MVSEEEISDILYGDRLTDLDKARPYIDELYRTVWGLRAPKICLVHSWNEMSLVRKSALERFKRRLPIRTGRTIRLRGHMHFGRFMNVFTSVLDRNASYLPIIVANMYNYDAAASCLRNIMRHVGSCEFMGRLCFVTPRPTRVVLDDLGRPHNFHGPAIEYDNCNENVYAIHGWRIPQEYSPLNLSRASMIILNLDEPIEQSIIDHIGRERYIRLYGKIVARDECGCLWVVSLNDRGQSAVYVEVENATLERGIRRKFFLRVPPHMTDPHEAIAWTFAMQDRDYKLTGAA